MANNLTRAQVDDGLAEVRQQLGRELKAFTAVLPAHIPPERFSRVILTALMNNPDLLTAPREQLFKECMKAAQDGLLPDGRLGALVPRGSAKKDNLSVTWQPMIAGIRQKARNSGDISTWDAHVVYENDFFEAQLGDAPQINHTFDLRKPRGEMIGAYSVCVMKDGSKSYEIMNKEQIVEIRDRSDAYRAFKAGYIKSTPWESDFDEMSRKTVAKRHSKVIPMSSDLDDLLRRDDDLYNFKGDKSPVDVTPAAPAPKSLSSRLDRLSQENDENDNGNGDVVDNETGEVTRTKQHEVRKAEQSGEDDGRKADGAPDLSAARRAGVDDAKAGKSRRAMPAEYRKDDALAGAYRDGFDSWREE